MIIAYAGHFGGLQAYGRMRDRDTKMAMLDLGFISLVHMMLILLALNFQWQSKKNQRKVLERKASIKKTA